MATSTPPASSVKRKSEEDSSGSVKRVRSSYSDILTVLVGHDEQRFTVHQDVICTQSGFFKAACAHGWKEAEEKIVRLPEIEAAFFEAYLERLYDSSANPWGRTLDIVRDGLEDATEGTQDDDDVNMLRIAALCDLWVIGNFLQDHIFRNAVMDVIVRHGDNIQPPDWLIKAIVRSSDRGSGLQSWLVYALVPKLSVTLLDTLEEQLPAAFLMDLLKFRVAGRVPGGDPAYANRCEFHEHPNGEAWCT